MSTSNCTIPVNPCPTIVCFDWGNSAVVITKRGHTRTYAYDQFRVHGKSLEHLWYYPSRWAITESQFKTTWRLLSEAELDAKDAKRIARNRRAQERRAANANGHHYQTRYASNAGGAK